MTALRCVQCGKLVNAGYLCDGCQYLSKSPATTSGAAPNLTGDPYGEPVKLQKFDALTVCAAAFVLVAGGVAWFLWPRVKESLNGAPSTVSTQAPSDGPQASAFDNGAQTQVNRLFNSSPPSTQSATAPLPPPHEDPPQQQSDAKARPRPVAIPVPVQTGSMHDAAEKDAQDSLTNFLNDYCKTRATQVKMGVQVSNIDWLPGGTGVVVKLNEGGSYRDGAAQYAPTLGWKWMVRPDAKSPG